MVAPAPDPGELLGRAIQMVLAFMGPSVHIIVTVPGRGSDATLVTMKAIVPGVGLVETVHTLEDVQREFDQGPDEFIAFVGGWLWDMAEISLSRLKERLGGS